MRLEIFHRSRLFRECLAAVLAEGKPLEVAHSDHTAPGCLARIESDPPDCVIVDVDLPGHFAAELVRRICDGSVPTKVLILTPHEPGGELFECMAAGAHGCLLETSSVEDLQDAIARLARGEMYYSPGIVDLVFRHLRGGGPQPCWRESDPDATLTPRELEVVGHIAERLSNKQIARRLSISLHTVKNHVHNIVEKLHVENRFEAVAYARRQQWLKSGMSRVGDCSR